MIFCKLYYKKIMKFAMQIVFIKKKIKESIKFYMVYFKGKVMKEAIEKL